ncbi:hypothetical protein F5051DRAFT_476295, partial [Lentinula edodes]
TASSFASSKGGIRSRTSVAHTPSSDPPSAFTSQTRPASFVRDSTPTVCPAAPLSYDEQAHFAKLSSSFGAGQGLGATGGGIVTPIESKMRPEKSVIAFRGFKEKREQSKIQARRRGEVVSVVGDDEDPKIRKARKKEGEVKDSKQAEAWRKPREVTMKIQYKTYEEILAEAGIETSTSARIGQIIDATGAVPRELIPHNVRLIAESCKTDIDGLAREGKLLEERKKLVVQEDLRLRKRIEDETELVVGAIMPWQPMEDPRVRALRFNVEDETLLETPVDIYGTKTVVSSPIPKQVDKKVSLQSLVFPWLPHVELSLEMLEGKQKLGATLPSDLRINPRNQSMEPIHYVLQWSSIFRPSILSQLFETEFFPKWIDVLRLWLIQPKVSFEEVVFVLESVSGISRGFTRGLRLMNQAIELGPDAPSQLSKPDYRAEQAEHALANSPYSRSSSNLILERVL